MNYENANEPTTTDLALKSGLAKLLAGEDILVKHVCNIPTAYFDPNDRILTLPMWATDNVHQHNMLLGHEVGHALDTPDSKTFDPSKFKPDFFGVVNVIEDVRIERKMLIRYPGLKIDFIKGYTKFFNDNFFNLEGRDLADMNLADKINVHFKGLHSGTPEVAIPFNKDEMVFVERAAKIKTFKETVELALDVYDFCKDRMKEEGEEEWDKVGKKKSLKVVILTDSGKEGEAGDDDGEKPDHIIDLRTKKDDNDKGDAPAGNKSEEDSDEEADGKVEGKNGEEETDEKSTAPDEKGADKSDGSLPDLVVETLEAFEGKLKDLIKMESNPIKYVEIPKKFDQDLFVVTWNKILSEFPAEDTDNDSLNRWKGNQKSLINGMVSEFERKRSAYSYAHKKTAETGIIDVQKLFKYRYDDKIFKTITKMNHGKNHGLVMYVDFSGSMNGYIGDTIKQIYTLVSFCRRVGIKHKVYAFTNVRLPGEPYSKWKDFKHNDNTKYDGIVSFDRFSLLELFSSNMSRSQFHKMFDNICSCLISRRTHSPYFRLGGTPLGEAIFCAIDYLPKFKAKNNLDIINCVFLTDGASNCLEHTGTSIDSDTSIGDGTIIVKNGRHYPIIKSDSFSENNITFQGIRLLKQIVPDCNVVNFFLGNRMPIGSDQDAYINSLKKDVNAGGFTSTYIERPTVVPSTVFDEIYVIPPKTFTKATKRTRLTGSNEEEILESFTNRLTTKKDMKVIASKFVSMIA